MKERYAILASIVVALILFTVNYKSSFVLVLIAPRFFVAIYDEIKNLFKSKNKNIENGENK